MLGLKDFKLQSEAEDSYHLVHPSGKTFTVQKSGLNEKARSAIQKMACGGRVQNMAAGGVVLPGAESAQPIIDQPVVAQPRQVPLEQGLSWLGNVVDKVANSSSPEMPGLDAPLANAAMAYAKEGPKADQPPGDVVLAPEAVSQQEVPEIAPQPAATQPQAMIPEDRSSLQSEKAIKNYMAQMNAASSAQVGAQQDYINQLQQAKTPDQMFQEYKAKDDQLLKHYMEQKVDPHRYLGNMSTGGKILAAVGIALSGLGAGAKGQNLALQQINKAIDDDIKAQENEQGKAMSLLRLNRERTQDEMQARAMTQNQLLTGVQAKIAMATSQSHNAEAQLRGNMLLQQIEQQKDQNRIAMLAANGQAPAQSLPPHLREVYVPGYGIASTKEAAKEANAKVATFKNIQSGIGQLLSLSKKGSSLSPADRAMAATIANMLKGQLRTEIVGPGAVSDSERAMLDAIVANPLEITRLDSASQAALRTLFERMQTSLNNSLVQYGIRPQQQITESAPNFGMR